MVYQMQGCLISVHCSPISKLLVTLSTLSSPFNALGLLYISILCYFISLWMFTLQPSDSYQGFLRVEFGEVNRKQFFFIIKFFDTRLKLS